MKNHIEEKLRNTIREVPDFPKPGINFYDLTTVFKDGVLLRETCDALAERLKKLNVDTVVGIEARGFIFGSVISYLLQSAFVPIRKAGKLPSETEQIKYSLEYGKDCLEIHKDALVCGQRVIIIDDLLATGGTAKGSVGLCQRLGATVVECCFVVELTSLNGRKKLQPTPVVSLVKYDS